MFVTGISRMRDISRPQITHTHLPDVIASDKVGFGVGVIRDLMTQ